MRVAAYYRVSSSTQKADDTIENQKQRGPENIARRGFTLVKEYEDNGETATSLESRAKFQELLRDAGNNLFDAVWVRDISRFDRASSSMEWALIKSVFRKH